MRRRARGRMVGDGGRGWRGGLSKQGRRRQDGSKYEELGGGVVVSGMGRNMSSAWHLPARTACMHCLENCTGNTLLFTCFIMFFRLCVNLLSGWPR